MMARDRGRARADHPELRAALPRSGRIPERLVLRLIVGRVQGVIAVGRCEAPDGVALEECALQLASAEGPRFALDARDPGDVRFVAAFFLPIARKATDVYTKATKLTNVFAHYGYRGFSSGGGGGGKKPPGWPWKLPTSGHYIDAPPLITNWLTWMWKYGKKNKAYAVWDRPLFLHVLNKGGEKEIMEKGLMAVPADLNGSVAVRGHTVEEGDIASVAKYTGTSQYFYITNQKARQDHDFTMSGVEWTVEHLPTIGWVLRFADGTFVIGGELLKHLDKSNNKPKD